MKRCFIVIAIFFSSINLSGCSSTTNVIFPHWAIFEIVDLMPSIASQSYLEPVIHEKRYFELSGLMFKPPQGSNWFLCSQDNKGIKFIKRTDRGRMHHISAYVFISDIEVNPVDQDPLEKFVRDSIKKELRNPRFQMKSMVIRAVNFRAQEGVEIDFTIADSGVAWAPGDVFLIKGKSVYTQNYNKRRRTIIEIGYSQSIRRGETFKDIENEIKPFLDSIKLPIQ